MGACGAKGRRRVEGTGEGGARGVPVRADRTAAEHTPRPPSAAASDLHKRVARQGQWRGRLWGASGALLAPIDRREEMPTRKVASDPEAPVPARAATGRQRRARARARPRAAVSKSAGEVPPNSGLAALRGWPADIGEGAYLWYSLKYGRACKGAAGRRAARRRTARKST